MGQFKPMVKMMTTEPTVELKLKKGGKVAKKADGGMMGSPMDAQLPPAMPARGGMMGAAAPMKPSLAMRRRAMRGMPAGAGPAGPVGGAAAMQPPMSMPPSGPAMKKGGKAEGGKMDMAQDKAMIKKAFKQHDMQEHKGGKGTSLKLKKGGKMAEGGKADMSQDKAMIKKAFKQHDMQEHKGGKGTSLKLKKGGKMATGGVVNGQGGYKKGGKVKMAKGGVAGDGIINTEGQGGAYRDTMMHTSKPDHSPAKTGGVKMGNGGGYATGGVAKSNGGGYKKGGKIPKMALGGALDGGLMGVLGRMNQPASPDSGLTPSYGGSGDASSGLKNVNEGASTIGSALKNIAGSVGSGGGGSPAEYMKRGGKASKKAYAAGGTVDSGRPVAMPQGRKPASKPVRINELAGTYKTGGKVTPAEGRLQKMSAAENAPAFRAAKMDSNEKYGPASKMKLKSGGRAC